MTRTLGLDVSKFQGHVPWKACYDEGVRFVFIKATEATGYTDPMFLEHVEGARKAGMLIGAYCYFWPSRDPIGQAKFFHATAGSLGLDLPPVLDFEDRKGVEGPWAIRAASRWLQETERLWDKQAIMYSYPSFLSALKASDDRDKETHKALGTRDLWIAHYTKAEPFVPAPWAEWKFWQFDGDKGRRLPNGVDADYNWFAGSEDDLRVYCGLPTERHLRTLEMQVPVEVPSAGDWVATLRDPLWPQLPTV